MRVGSARILVAIGVGVCLPFACTVKDGDDAGEGGTGGEAGDTGGAAGSSRGGEAGDSASGGSSRGGRGGTSQGGSDQGGTAGDGGAGTSTGGSGNEGGNPCAHCESGVCLADATCVECTEDEHCDGATPRCNADENVCVECLATEDNCPEGQRCGDSFTCIPGCKADGSSCASGSCLTNGDCDLCILDNECIDGRVCANGTCSDPCTGEGTSCGAGNTCCSMHCVDTTRTVEHCGGCSAAMPAFACAADEFCGSMGCADAVIANVCQNGKAAVVRDMLAANQAAGAVLGMALAGCLPAPTVRSVEQGMLDVSNPVTGQPLVGPGELLLIAGGAFGQMVAQYFQDEGTAPLLQVGFGDRYEIHRSSDDSLVAGTLQSNANATHDMILFQVMRDPPTATFVFNVAGFNQSGTAAGAWYFENVMVPAISTYTNTWYVYEWTDGGGNQMPDSSDTFTLLAEAP